MIDAKSGWPVNGQRHVNSGTSIWIAKSRSGAGLANVSSVLLGCEGMIGSAAALSSRTAAGEVAVRVRYNYRLVSDQLPTLPARLLQSVTESRVSLSEINPCA